MIQSKTQFTNELPQNIVKYRFNIIERLAKFTPEYRKEFFQGIADQSGFSIAEVKRLLESIKLTDSIKDKWITDNLANLSEIESEKVDGVIKHLKSKITPAEAPPFVQSEIKEKIA